MAPGYKFRSPFINEHTEMSIEIAKSTNPIMGESMFTHEPVYLLDNYDGKSKDQNQAAAAAGFERYFPVNKALYNSILANVEVNLPIVLDPVERAILRNDKASIVIGRSGTGKTTALVYKLRAIHLQAQGSTIRQMVVTRSRVLAKHIEATFRSLNESASIASKTPTELTAMAQQYQQQSDPALIEFDNELDLREDLPSRFSHLEDSHFPLFVSFDKLCSLLEGDLLAHERSQKLYKISVRHDNVINYKKFQFEYWPKFNRTHKHGLESAFVYSEIMGVIKGSSKAMESPDGFLSRDQYLGGAARQSLNRVDERLGEKIYSIFEHYRKLRGERYERDPADRTRSLLKFLGNNEAGPSQSQLSETYSPNGLVDFLYVDEVQDNLMSDVHLLRSLCANVRNTYWGGDTAQTIVAGSAFRIRDLGVYLFNEGMPVGTHQSTSSPVYSRFDLVGNFRSHTGIVNCAASVIKVIFKLFPASLDHMDNETARWKGPPPVAFRDAGPDISSFEQFLLRSRLAASCFNRGGHALKAKIASSYHQMSRAKGHMLRGDTRESRSGLRQAAKALDQCAADEKTAGQTQSARHLRFHAATCLELAHEIREAALMFVKAGHHERAIRSLFGQGLMGDGVRILLAHRRKLDNAIEQELLNYSRSYYFSKFEYSFLPPLFDHNLDEELSYARKNNFRLQLKHLLEQNERFYELALVHLEERTLADALDCFSKDFTKYDRTISLSEGASVVFGYAENVFGLEAKKSIESLKKLRAMLDKLKLHESALQPRYKKELSLFYRLLDRHRFVDTTWVDEWDPDNQDEKVRKIMLLHLSLDNLNRNIGHASTPSLRNHLAVLRTYNSFIAPIIEASNPSRLLAAQRLLAFKPAQSDLYINTQFIVSEESVIYECSKQHRVPIQRSTYGDLLFPAIWVDKLVKDGLREPLDRQLRLIYEKLYCSGQLSSICRLITDRLQPPKLISASHIEYQSRLETISLAMSSISPICHIPLEGTQTGKSSILQLWIQRLFDIVNPGSGALEEIDLTQMLDSQSIMCDVQACIEAYMVPIHSEAASNMDFSSLVIGYSLATHFKTQSSTTGRFKATTVAIPNSDSLKQHDDPPIYQPSINDQLSSFFDWSDPNGLTHATHIISTILAVPTDPLDATHLIHFVEWVTRDMIYHNRNKLSNQEGVSRLILPMSWARRLAKQYRSRSTVRDTSSLPNFLESIVLLSDGLRYDKRRNWLVGDKSLQSRSNDIFNLRLCWCIALLLVNARHPVGFADPVMSSLIHLAGDKYGRALQTPWQRYSP
ncbi:hypothetical protein RSOL_424550, partial [Rhizoctonia solani AG-3 Rhs1AP]